jgi:hypothetical protein
MIATLTPKNKMKTRPKSISLIYLNAIKANLSKEGQKSLQTPKNKMKTRPIFFILNYLRN